MVVGLTATPLSPAQCISEAIKQAQKHTAVEDTRYASQIELARNAANDIYEHGLVGNSGSAINGKIGRPPGMAVAVAVNGKLVWAEGIGIADLEHCVAVTPDTKFRIGSTSKPLTAVGAELLADQGPGIRGYTATDGDIENQTPYAFVTASLSRFKDDPLFAPPRALNGNILPMDMFSLAR